MGSENLGTENHSSQNPPSLYISAEEILPDLEEAQAPLEGAKGDTNLSVHRRDFMRLFSLTAVAGAASCVRRPVEKAIPYVNQPIDETPGVAVHYASTCGSCPSGCGIMVKTREGRPVKIEGNGEHPINQGGLCAFGQAELQGLYHPERLSDPQVRQGQQWQKETWENAFAKIASQVQTARKVGIFTRGATGNRHNFFEDVLVRLGLTKDQLYVWESNSLYASTAEAHRLAFGHADLPRIEFNKAQYIVSVGSDFQVSGLSPISHSKGFAEGRTLRPNKQRNKFVAFESHLTITGATADVRHVIAPGSETLVTLLIVKALFENPLSKGSVSERAEIAKILKEKEEVLNATYSSTGLGRDVFEQMANDILNHPSLVMVGSGASFDENATLLQLAGIMANVLSGAYGTFIHFNEGWARSPVRNGDLERFIADAAQLDVLFIIDSDPVFTVPNSWKIGEAIAKIPTVVSMQYFPVETDRFAHFILPVNHNLESWGDESSNAGFWSMRQAVVRPIKGTCQAEDALLFILASASKHLPYQDYRAYLKEKWKAIYQVLAPSVTYETFFKAVIRRGFIGKMETRAHTTMLSLVEPFKKLKPTPSGFILSTTIDHRLLDGLGAHLPVLQEIGDSLTTIAWDTWLAMNPKTMQKMGLQRNSVVKLTTAEGSIELAIYPLPGLHPQALVVPRGNGHEDERSTISYKNGVNPLKLFAKATDPLSGQPVTSGSLVEIKPTEKTYRLAAMQKALGLEGRTDIVKTLTVKEAQQKRKLKKSLDDVPDLFPKLEETQYRWGLSIDLDKCNGCGACMVACAVENNVPQTGRDQILMHREMHWIRLDRYFHGDLDNPGVSFQPVMCQHCNQAPCEGVCPVFATSHDPEGLNAMTYNRCVGTRYCANACPYKVRRFNWWTHKWGEMGERLQDRNPRPTNPDVTVRTRGVMEKCSLCVQRTRDAKHLAKEQNRTVQDGEFVTACAQTCPMNAIVSGNLNDAASHVSRLRRDGRAYLMLGGEPEHGHFGLKTLPNVNYLAELSLEEKKAKEGHS